MHIDNINQLARQFQALSNPVRLRILSELDRNAMYSDRMQHLEEIDAATLPHVSELARQLHVPQPALSNHLKTMASAGLLKVWKVPRCNLTLYFIDGAALAMATGSITPGNV